MSAEPLQNLLDHLQDQPDDWSLRARVCDAMLMEGRLGEAISLLDAAPSPPAAETHVLKAAEIYTMSQPHKAVPLLYAYLQADPSSALAHLAMAEAAIKLGQLETAQTYYERTVELNPSYRDPDFERKHGIVLPGPIPSSLPTAAPSSSAAPKAASAATRPAPAPSAGIPAWVFTLLAAASTFLFCWMLLALALRSLLLQAPTP